MMLRNLLLVVCGLVPVTTLLAADANPAAPYNVLFIMADDLRPELASYGSSAKTPNLDRLAQQSLQFNQAYCQQSLCNPSRSSMLTGKRPDTLHLWSNGIHFRDQQPDVMTLPLWFKQHGYITRCAGKIFHNWHTEVHGDPRSWSEPEFLHYANHGDDKPQVDAETLPPDQATAPKCECRDVPDNAYYDGRVADEAVKAIEALKQKTFFLAVGFWKPHSPFNAPKKYWDLYDRQALPQADQRRGAKTPELAYHDGRELRGQPPNQLTFTAEQIAEIRHGYWANISYMDAQVGKVLDALDRNGLRERTVVVFVGDHGYHLGEHGLWAKTSNFDLDTRVPLLVSVPGQATRGQRSDALVELIDLFPTLVDVCQLPKPPGLEGTSLVPVVADPSRSVKDAAYHQHPRPAYFDREPSKQPQAMGYGVRTKHWHYIQWQDSSNGSIVAEELYDLGGDRAELENLAAEPKQAAAVAEGRRLLRLRVPLR